MRRHAGGLAAVALLAGLAARASGATAPGVSVDGPVDLERLLQITRLREAATARLVYTYTYRQTTTEEELDARGAVRRSGSRVYQVVPTPQGVERQLIGKDGEEPSEAEVRKQDRRNEALQKRWEKLAQRAQRDAEAKRAEQPKPAAPAAPAPRAPAAAVGPKRPAATSPAPLAATGTASAVTAPASPMTAPPSPVTATAPATATTSPARLPEPRAPLPDCDLTAPLRAVRPPMPGSITRSAAMNPGATDAVRRKRERASDYSLFELLTLTDHEYAGACSWEGRPMHVVSFRPPEGFDALNPVERVMAAMTGTILIDGGDMEVARAEGATSAPLTWGAGMVKLRSARVLLEYGRVQGELWLPKRDVFEFSTRVVFDSEITRVTHAFDDFRKAQVETEFEYGGPVETETVRPAPGQ